MSWEMQGVVAKLNHDISATEKWVLMILASFTNKEGKNAYPSARSISDICRVTERTVRRVRAKFFHNGVLTRGVGRRRSKGVCYNINPDRTLVLHYREPEKADSVSGVEREKAERVSGVDVIGDTQVEDFERQPNPVSLGTAVTASIRLPSDAAVMMAARASEKL